MHRRVIKAACAAAIAGLILTPTMATASAPAPLQPVNQLVAVSAFGSQASAQVVDSQALPAASAAQIAVMAQGASFDTERRSATNYGINWPLLALGTFFLLAGLYTLFVNDDDDDGAQVPISPD